MLHLSEILCPGAPAGCPSRQFQCGTGECVDPVSVCNTSTDCVDGSDEGAACHTDACSSPGSPQCALKCYNTPLGAVGTKKRGVRGSVVVGDNRCMSQVMEGIAGVSN